MKHHFHSIYHSHKARLGHQAYVPTSRALAGLFGLLRETYGTFQLAPIEPHHAIPVARVGHAPRSGFKLSGPCPAQTETQTRLLQQCLCCMLLVGVGCSCSMAYCPSPSPPPASAGCQATVPSALGNADTQLPVTLWSFMTFGVNISAFPSVPVPRRESFPFPVLSFLSASLLPAAPSQPYKYLPLWRRALPPCLPGCPPHRLTRLRTFILSINPLNHTSSKSMRD